MEKNDLNRTYKKNELKFNELVEKEKKLLLLLSLFRLFVFTGGIFLSWIIFRVNNIAGIAVFLFSATLFVSLLKKFASRTWQKDFYQNLLSINRNELSALEGDYSSFEDGRQYSNQSHDFSHDIDLFGSKSLFQYINRTSTNEGSDILAGWLLSPYELSGNFARRREAIIELVSDLDWRQEFIALGKMNKSSRDDRQSFDDWLNESYNLSGQKVFNILRFALPALTIISLAMSVAGWLHFSVFTCLFLGNLLLVTINLKEIKRIHSLVTKRFEFLSTMRWQVDHFVKRDFAGSFLIDLSSGMSGEGIPAAERIRNLSKIIQGFDSRLNMFAGVLINGLLLWDYHCVIKIEKWKISTRHMLPGWFNNLGTLDAMISLANYAGNNPTFAYPELADDSEFLETVGLGHMLISADERVVNDFTIDRQGMVFIITGANMAGKSTFLRTVAVNLVFAMMGAPVCALKFRFTPIKLFSSMRTTDSLSEHESYFYAELKRLKILKDRLEKEKNIFFVLDEILKGTNSKDKSEGSWLFLEKITRYGATGIVATHDISLGTLEDKYPDNFRNKCFEIEIEEDIKFDFLLRNGITTRMNAALLMKQQGIID